MPTTTEQAPGTVLADDPDFEAYRDGLTVFLRYLRGDMDLVWEWLAEGLEAGGQLAFITAMLALADYDREVPPGSIVRDLWYAFDAAQDQAPGTGPAMGRSRALARVIPPGAAR